MPIICLTQETFARVDRYAKAAGLTHERTVNKIIGRWMDEQGDNVIAELDRRRREGKGLPKRSIARRPKRSPSTKVLLISHNAQPSPELAT